MGRNSILRIALSSIATMMVFTVLPAQASISRKVVETPKCELLTEGEKASVGKMYRVAVNGRLVESADSVEELGGKISQLESKGVCQVEKNVDCRFSEEGEVAAQYKRIRLQRGEQVFAGADTFLEAMEQARVLISSGVCRGVSQSTALASEGLVGGAWMKHRILIEGEPVFGANDMGTLLAQLNDLKSL